jgi:hypothetical protein
MAEASSFVMSQRGCRQQGTEGRLTGLLDGLPAYIGLGACERFAGRLSPKNLVIWSFKEKVVKMKTGCKCDIPFLAGFLHNMSAKYMCFEVV